ncbi:hypothetical protein [uncultured Actinobacillus sp.]|uniref:hypothetical protein n=1 Tax=uncultured Actinobacillus sp. TaxID=417616 RepID=UPI0025EEF37C|nr:hypothetical protein [uncultured Actinobacillus sp.]
MKNKTFFFWFCQAVYMFTLSFISLFLTHFLLLSLFSILNNWDEYIQDEVYVILSDSFNLSLIGSSLLTLISFLKIFILLKGRDDSDKN